MNGSYEVCPVCFWEDDPVQNEDPSYGGGANAVSLTCARENYVQYGACEPALFDSTRAPRTDEVPPPTLIAGLDSEKRLPILRGIKTSLLGIVRGMLSGQIATLEGCCAVAAVASPLNEPELNELLLTFEGVASEVDELPSAITRDLWSPEALITEDAKAAEYENRIRGSVRDACVRIQSYLQAQLG